MRRILSRVAVLALLLPGPARAIDPALCADDGVTEVPAFATGRDANGCLLVDPGNGEAAIPFQYEFFHGTGFSKSSKDGGETGTFFDMSAVQYGRCRTKDTGDYCTFLLWDMTIDNYLGPQGRNDDIWTNSSAAAEVLYVKDSKFMNGWKCAGGGGWTGPNGVSCAPGDASTSHSDGIQQRLIPVNEGWVVYQDSVVANAHISLMLLSGDPQYGNAGSMLFQGVQLGIFNTPLGQAVNWSEDCFARGATDACLNNRVQMNYPAKALWLVDVWGNTRFSAITSDLGRIVVVNSGCGTSGCGGPIGYLNGWPHPLGPGKDAGPGVCPNGLMPGNCAGTDNTGRCYCYTSLENALGDTFTSTSGLGDCPDCPHERPPFLHLSTSGWQTPP
jgi:hypothetical protein